MMVLVTAAAAVGVVTTASVAEAAPPPVGTVTDHAPYPDAGIKSPRGVAGGPDGAMWVTGGVDRILRVTSGGAVTLYRDPTINIPTKITAGPDGALWFINSGNGSLGRITTSGVVSAFTDPALAGVEYLTAGPDGAVWFTRSLPSTLGRITPAGLVSLFTDPLLLQPRDITTGPDGALWFANGGDISRISTAGAVTTFDLPAPDPWVETRVTGITVGPDGALYFSQVSTYWGYYQGRAGRLTTAGVATVGAFDSRLPGKLVTAPNGTMYVLSSGETAVLTTSLELQYRNVFGDDVAAAPDNAFWNVSFYSETVRRNGVVVARATERHGNSITRGPDGALWYLTAPSSIDRLAPDGTLTRFPSPSTFLDTSSLVLGSDGALWFPGDNGHATVNRVAMDGSVTATVVPVHDVMGLAAGPDGALWFTQPGSNGIIGRITTHGVVSTFTHPQLAPGFIVAGRDGALWFTNGGSIGRITTEGVISFRGQLYSESPSTGLTLGPDGALWWVRQTNPLSIARLETGPISSYYGTVITTTITNAKATGAAWGPDGRLWLTLSTGAVIRMTTAGTYETFALPAQTRPTAITAGPDGGMWFTQDGVVPSAGTSYAVRRIEALGALTAPSAPDLVAASGDGTVTATWTVGDGGSPITGVTVTLAPGGATCTWTSGPQSCTISGLTNGTTYTATARASNSVGVGPPNGTLATAVPHKRPAQPVFVKAVNVANDCARVTWWPPQGEPIVKAVISAVRVSDGYATTHEFAGAASAQTVCTIFPVTTSVTFTIVLVSAFDSGQVSNPTNPVVIGAPATPGKPVAKSGDGRAVVSWSNGPVAQTYTQSVITPYRNGVAQPAQTFTSGAASQTITGLDNGATYTFTVATRNANGTSVASDRSASIVVGLPSAPAFVSAVAGTASAKVQWWPPAVPVTSSTVTPYLNGVAQAPLVFNDAKSAQTISGLSSGQSYTFVVALTNATGTGPTSTTAAVIIG